MRRITILLAMAAALMLVGAAGASAAPKLKVNIIGLEGGGGEVKSPYELHPPEYSGTPPIECNLPEGEGSEQEGVCENEMYFEEEEGFYVVSLRRLEGPNSKFLEWEVVSGFPFFGCEVAKEGFCMVVSFGEEAEVNAYFACQEGKECVGEEPPVEGPKLTLNIEEGSGTVVSNPAGLECTGEAPESCSTEGIAEGSVTLTASPAPGYLFKSWKKCDTGGVNGRQCTINLNEAKTIGAKFVKVWSLEGSKSGGLGILNTSPGGVNCGYACNSSSALYKEGSLTVKSKPAKNYHFVEFDNGTGSASSCTGVTAETCTFTITEDSSVEEVYAPNAKNTLTLAKEGGGQGFVKTKPTNINCGYTCTAAEAEFYAAEEPSVTVTLGKGTTSVTWTTGAGTCTGNALTCSVPMSESHELVAKFE